MRSALVTAGALVAAGLIAAPIAQAQRGGHHGRHHDSTLAVLGDTPYGQPQVDNFPNDVAEINADPHVRLVMHLGDIKNGSSECSTSYFERVRSDFDRFGDPLIYTPGDNEWTDCHRANNGGYWPAGPVLNGDPRPARLGEIRRIFFDRPGRTLGRHSRRVRAQGGPYVENVRWRQGGVVFGTLHVPGSNNGWAPWFDQPRTSSQIREVKGRTRADLRWLDGVFDAAERGRAPAVVIGIQADAWDPDITGDPAQYDHFTPLVRRLAARSRRFGRPVLLLNGDSHVFTDDRPLADPARPQNREIYGIGGRVPNLRRITTNGSTIPCHEWIRLRVRLRSREVFSYERVRFSRQPGFDPAVCPAG